MLWTCSVCSRAVHIARLFADGKMFVTPHLVSDTIPAKVCFLSWKMIDRRSLNASSKDVQADFKEVLHPQRSSRSPSQQLLPGFRHERRYPPLDGFRRDPMEDETWPGFDAD